MASLTPTYVSDGNGKIAAFHGDKCVASGNDFAKVAEDAESYFDSLLNVKKKKTDEEDRTSATHITTPNGEKGTILGRTASVFSDGITVRFENGQIRHYDTFVGDGLTYTKEAADAPKSPVEYFQRKLDEAFVASKTGLVDRLASLNEIKRDAAHLASQGVSYKDGQALHNIVLAADAERMEVGEALEHLVAADAEAMVAPRQAYTAVEQASMGRSDDWLEVVAQEMVRESEAQDFDALLVDGPVTFVSGLDTAVLNETALTHTLASDHIVSKTAGFQGPEVEEYRDRFLASVEIARRQELEYRKEAATETATKEASLVTDALDESLFL